MFGTALKYLIMALLINQFHGAQFVMKSVRCTTMDPQFARFDLCEVTTNNGRDHISGISLIVRLLQVPVTNCRVGIELRFANPTRVPLLNNSWDGCAFMRNRKRNVAFSRLYDYIAPYTDMNHSCPYNHDIYLTNFTLSGKKPLMPAPNGIYIVNTKYTIGGKVRFTIDFTVELKN